LGQGNKERRSRERALRRNSAAACANDSSTVDRQISAIEKQVVEAGGSHAGGLKFNFSPRV